MEGTGLTAATGGEGECMAGSHGLGEQWGPAGASHGRDAAIHPRHPTGIHGAHRVPPIPSTSGYDHVFSAPF